MSITLPLPSTSTQWPADTTWRRPTSAPEQIYDCPPKRILMLTTPEYGEPGRLGSMRASGESGGAPAMM